MNLHKKYTIIFGSLFNNIFLRRFDIEDVHESGYLNRDLLKEIKVPVNFGDKNKFILRYLRRDVSLGGVKITLPRIAFSLVNYNYDSERKLNKMYKIIDTNNDKIFTPVPYNLSFELSIISNKNSDNAKIIEQIIPRFRPYLNVSTNLMSDIDEKFDINVVLKSIFINDPYENKINDERIITTTLLFEMKAWFFKENIEEGSGIIETIYTNFFDMEENEHTDEQLIITEDDL